jgi:pimeloyl-ACP methyl ester carboxylesterase
MVNMEYRDFFIDTVEGKIATRDYGGNGKDILLIHGSGHNLEAWQSLANILSRNYRVWAFDLRGHGQTTLKSKNCLQYWQDIDTIINKLKINPVLLIGHSMGGYAITAYTVWKNCSIPILILDGFVLDKFDAIPEGSWSKVDKDLLWKLFKYGWEADKNEMEKYIENESKNIPEDSLNYGINPQIIKTITRRSFYQNGEKWLRKPTFEEIEIYGEPKGNEEIIPDVNIYSKIQSPIGFVAGLKGFYVHRKSEILNIVNENQNRYYYEIDCSHNLHLIKPNDTAKVVFDFMGKENK